MPIQGLPTFTLPGEELAHAPLEAQTILDSILKGRQAQERIGQQSLANEQLNKYRMAELGLDRDKLNSDNQLNPLRLDLLRAQIEAQKELAKQRSKGMIGGRFGSGTGDELKYQSTVAEYNPGLTPEQLREAADAYAEGRETLSDGTKLAKMTPTLQRALDRAYKSTTTSALVTQGVRANAAEAEMPIIDKAIQEGRDPYGDTVFGYSSQHMKDTFNQKDEKAQERLGNYIASDLLAYDKAALQTRLAGTESGVTIIQEIMDKAKQTVSSKYPMLSNKARQVALEKVGQVLRDMVEARNKYGLGATQAVNLKGKSSEENVPKNEASVILYKNGKQFRIPPKLMQKALQEGFTLGD